jgi:hypothetical protein
MAWRRRKQGNVFSGPAATYRQAGRGATSIALQQQCARLQAGTKQAGTTRFGAGFHSHE